MSTVGNKVKDPDHSHKMGIPSIKSVTITAKKISSKSYLTSLVKAQMTNQLLPAFLFQPLIKAISL